MSKKIANGLPFTVDLEIRFFMITGQECRNFKKFDLK